MFHFLFALMLLGQPLVVNGQTVVLHGVNRAGTEYMCSGGSADAFDGPWDQASVDAMKSWHINAVRLPLNEDCWLGINGIPQAMTSDKYRQEIVSYVNLLTSNGLYVVLDLHWNAPGAQPSTGSQVMADMDHSPAFWTSVAQTFAANPNVLFDLYNEPHDITWQCLRDGCIAGFQTAGMQTLVSAVRSTGAHNVIMVGGLQYANDLSQWLAYRPQDSNLAASWHTYNFNGCVTASCWQATVAPVLASVPVVTGEMGENDCAHGYIDSVMSWLDSNGGSYLGWAWNTYDCNGFPSLITSYDGSPTNYGIGLRDHLATLKPCWPPKAKRCR